MNSHEIQMGKIPGTSSEILQTNLTIHQILRTH